MPIARTSNPGMPIPRRLGLRVLLALMMTLLLALLVACEEPDGEPPTDYEAVRDLFADWDHTDTPGCAAAAERAGEGLLSDAWGMADLEHGIALEEDSLFEAGSVSKQFTTALVMKLVEDGELSLDEDIREHIPELPDHGESITLRQLIHHTSGLRDWGSVAAISGWGRGERSHEHAHVLDILSRQEALNFAPGEHYSYSNSGYNLMVVLIERVTGEDFAELSRERLLEPAGMEDSRWRTDYTDVVPGRTAAYSGEAGDEEFSINRPIEHVHGNAALLTTVGDLLRWNRALETELFGETFDEHMHRRGKLNNGRELDYAAALRFDRDHGTQTIGHTGATSGYRAYLSRFPDQKLSVAVLCNVDGVDIGEKGSELAGILLGEDAPADEKDTLPDPVAMDDELLEARTGIWADERNHQPLRLVRDGDRLRIPPENDGDDQDDNGEDDGQAVTPVAADRFHVEDADHELVFEPGESEDREVLHIRRDGYDEERLLPVDEARPESLRPEDLGRFVNEEAETALELAREDDELVARRRPDREFTLEPVYADAFRHDELGLIRLQRNEDEEVIGLSYSNPRVYDLRFERVGGQ